MVRPKVSAAYSGLIVPPPRKLKPPLIGISRSNGAPSAAQTTIGNTTSNPIAAGQTFGRTPVSACRLAATREYMMVPISPQQEPPPAPSYAPAPR